MSLKANLLVVCGTGVATSTVVVENLKKKLPDFGVDEVDLTKGTPGDASEKAAARNFDAVVTTTQLDESKFGIPVIQTTAFMTGMGEDEVLEEIVGHVEAS